ncbi:hypothetical protein Anapl_05865 [Anas platyrhynchos]|uniref:Uncharacterized protein n=1 Tax=Anas platyrhynchos TaxID=8839 RepID=R0M7B9_ANAPL|nr:hypothetical protein Anapl_05865 [Anas platyrhynchos]
MWRRTIKHSKNLSSSQVGKSQAGSSDPTSSSQAVLRGDMVANLCHTKETLNYYSLQIQGKEEFPRQLKQRQMNDVDLRTPKVQNDVESYQAFNVTICKRFNRFLDTRKHQSAGFAEVSSTLLVLKGCIQLNAQVYQKDQAPKCKVLFRKALASWHQDITAVYFKTLAYNVGKKFRATADIAGSL